jgi:hypothetical protein
MMSENLYIYIYLVGALLALLGAWGYSIYGRLNGHIDRADWVIYFAMGWPFAVPLAFLFLLFYVFVSLDEYVMERFSNE